jgi:hypothetical protein
MPYPQSSTTWKNTKAVFHTAAEPPKVGRSILATIGSTANKSAAPKKLAIENNNPTQKA